MRKRHQLFFFFFSVAATGAVISVLFPDALADVSLLAVDDAFVSAVPEDEDDEDEELGSTTGCHGRGFRLNHGQSGMVTRPASTVPLKMV